MCVYLCESVCVYTHTQGVCGEVRGQYAEIYSLLAQYGFGALTYF